MYFCTLLRISSTNKIKDFECHLFWLTKSTKSHLRGWVPLKIPSVRIAQPTFAYVHYPLEAIGTYNSKRNLIKNSSKIASFYPSSIKIKIQIIEFLWNKFATLSGLSKFSQIASVSERRVRWYASELNDVRCGNFGSPSPR